MRNIIIWSTIVLLSTATMNYLKIINLSMSSLLVGFFSSAMILMATALSFSNMVKKSILNKNITLLDDRDVIDKIDDPYDLYSESDTQDLSLTEEKKLHKSQRISFLDSVKNSKASISLYRIFSYGLMVIGFFYLKDNHLFSPISYIMGITLPVLVVVIVLFVKGRYDS